ncbi:MAG TPA: amidohydrolase family protein [Burkholderiales bacterium]|nr:amidohydrolase family protein [Burkholderiales bacterium]
MPIETPATAPLVDCHAHVYTTGMPLAATAWHRPPHDASIEQYLATLDEHGVRFAVLAAASLYGYYNDYSILATRKHSRLRTTAILPPDADPYIMRMMKADGVVGVRFQFRTLDNPPDLAAPEYRLLLRRIADLDWHVHLHDEGPRLPRPIAALEAAGVKLVIDHFGRPDPAQGVNGEGFKAVLRSIERGRTWVKLSAGYRLASPALAVECARVLLEHAGPERLLWGSDWPFAAFESKVRYRDTVENFAAWVPDAAARRIIGGETALKLYFE